MEKRSLVYYREQLLAHLPQGKLWPREPGTNLYAMIEAHAVLLAGLWNRMVDLRNEADPRSALETLFEWEVEYGLPDPCFGENQTIQERRAALVSKVYARGGASKAYFIEVARKLGFEITITEYGLFLPDQSCADDPCCDDEWCFVWRVHAPDTTERLFRADESSADEPLSSWGNEPLECTIRRLAPAHTTVLFGYGDA